MSTILAESVASDKCTCVQHPATPAPAWQREKPKPAPIPSPPVDRSLLWLPDGGLVHLDWRSPGQRWEAYIICNAVLGFPGDALDDAERASVPALIAAVEASLATLRAYVAAQEVPSA